ncbi:hypothetical protein FGO68_gene15537 [Halteria grandinella]|uniref:Arylamine N-acetyltransferase n=1 Tax=Halteria grandinella TaxID=5974 RepID=A0A8J8NMZ7_HALGN|nr:hypothetical protein FGO68_gene15537 [Halteria grandinella]
MNFTRKCVYRQDLNSPQQRKLYTSSQISYLKNKKPLPIDLDALIERMCTKDQGGMCYEHDLLIYYLLKHVGFDVSFIEVDHSSLQRLWNPKVVSSHSFVFVELNGASYLLDPGLGFRGYRYPIEFDPSKDLNEVYLLESNYQKRLFTTEAMIPARDSRLFTAKRFEEGVLLTMFIKDADEFVAFRKEFKLGRLVEKHFYKNYEEFREDTLKLIGIQFPSREEVIAKVYE